MRYVNYIIKTEGNQFHLYNEVLSPKKTSEDKEISYDRISLGKFEKLNKAIDKIIEIELLEHDDIMNKDGTINLDLLAAAYHHYYIEIIHEMIPSVLED